MIVVGTRGQTGLRRLILGSVARNVLLHAPCSVLVVRGGPHAALRRSTSASRIRSWSAPSVDAARRDDQQQERGLDDVDPGDDQSDEQRQRVPEQPSRRRPRPAATARNTRRTPRTRPGTSSVPPPAGPGRVTGAAPQAPPRHRPGPPGRRRRLDDRIERSRRSCRPTVAPTTASDAERQVPRSPRSAGTHRDRHLVADAIDDPPGAEAGLAGRRVGRRRVRATRAGRARPGRTPARDRSATGPPASGVCEWTIPQKTSSASSVSIVRRSRSCGSIS